MVKEFNLSEKEVEVEELGKIFLPEDIKEFIKIILEKQYSCVEEMKDEVINRAGSKLINCKEVNKA